MKYWIVIAFIALCASCKGPKALPLESMPAGLELAALDSAGDVNDINVASIDPSKYKHLSKRQQRRQLEKDREALVKIAKYQAGPRKIKTIDKSKVKEKPTIKSKPVVKTKTDNSQNKGAWKAGAVMWVVAGAVLLVVIYFPRFKRRSA